MTRLLIVDDEPFTIDMLQTFLEISGYEVFSALNGEDGLVLVKVEQPDIMILDLMLPDIEGYEVCQRLRSFPDTSGLPILILSARVEAASRERAIKAGADGYLTKPVQFPDLLSELTRLQALKREKPVESATVTPQPPLPQAAAPGSSSLATMSAAPPPTAIATNSATPAPQPHTPGVDVPATNPIPAKPDKPGSVP